MKNFTSFPIEQALWGVGVLSILDILRQNMQSNVCFELNEWSQFILNLLLVQDIKLSMDVITRMEYNVCKAMSIEPHHPPN